jgi:hypothetical protein
MVLELGHGNLVDTNRHGDVLRQFGTAKIFLVSSYEIDAFRLLSNDISNTTACTSKHTFAPVVAKSKTTICESSYVALSFLR